MEYVIKQLTTITDTFVTNTTDSFVQVNIHENNFNTEFLNLLEQIKTNQITSHIFELNKLTLRLILNNKLCRHNVLSFRDKNISLHNVMFNPEFQFEGYMTQSKIALSQFSKDEINAILKLKAKASDSTTYLLKKIEKCCIKQSIIDEPVILQDFNRVLPLLRSSSRSIIDEPVVLQDFNRVLPLLRSSSRSKTQPKLTNSEPVVVFNKPNGNIRKRKEICTGNVSKKKRKINLKISRKLQKIKGRKASITKKQKQNKKISKLKSNFMEDQYKICFVSTQVISDQDYLSLLQLCKNVNPDVFIHLSDFKGDVHKDRYMCSLGVNTIKENAEKDSDILKEEREVFVQAISKICNKFIGEIRLKNPKHRYISIAILKSDEDQLSTQKFHFDYNLKFEGKKSELDRSFSVLLPLNIKANILVKPEINENRIVDLDIPLNTFLTFNSHVYHAGGSNKASEIGYRLHFYVTTDRKDIPKDTVHLVD